MAEFVDLSVEDSIATITLARPPMNVLNASMQSEIAVLCDGIAQRHDVSAVIIYGGPKVFAAGADVKEMVEWSLPDALRRTSALQAAFTAVASVPQPTIAAITGFALGGGCELALCCDFRVAGDNARLGQPEILLGIIPGAGGTQRLPRLIGTARAKEMILSGRFVSADEAERIGLVDKGVAPDDVYSAAREWAGDLVRGPALAIRAAKAAIDRGIETDLATGLEIERVHFASLFGTSDQQVGMATFVDKGPGQAEFSGS